METEGKEFINESRFGRIVANHPLKHEINKLLQKDAPFVQIVEEINANLPEGARRINRNSLSYYYKNYYLPMLNQAKEALLSERAISKEIDGVTCIRQDLSPLEQVELVRAEMVDYILNTRDEILNNYLTAKAMFDKNPSPQWLDQMRKFLEQYMELQGEGLPATTQQVYVVAEQRNILYKAVMDVCREMFPEKGDEYYARILARMSELMEIFRPSIMSKLGIKEGSPAAEMLNENRGKNRKENPQQAKALR